MFLTIAPFDATIKHSLIDPPWAEDTSTYMTYLLCPCGELLFPPDERAEIPNHTMLGGIE